jgi:uncharacterized membrane protein YccC
LTSVADGLSFAIRGNKRRTPEERRELADAAAALLAEFHKRMAPAPGVPGQPEDQARRDVTISHAFLEWFETQKRHERQRIISRAAWWALREKAGAWLRGEAHQPSPYWTAVESDDGMFAMLKELDRFPRRTEG